MKTPRRCYQHGQGAKPEVFLLSMTNVAILPAPFKAGPSLSSESAKSIQVRLPGGGTATFRGRTAFTLRRLLGAGSRGITPQDFAPGLRLAHYVFSLKREGVPIDAVREKHAGPFPGQHARYKLSAPVIEIEQEAA